MKISLSKGRKYEDYSLSNETHFPPLRNPLWNYAPKRNNSKFSKKVVNIKLFIFIYKLLAIQ